MACHGIGNGNGNSNCNGNGNNNNENTIMRTQSPQLVTETPDVCDANTPLLATGDLRVLDPIFTPYGRRKAFCGHVVIVKTFEDNKLVKDTILNKTSILKNDTPQVLVIDAGGSRRRAMVGGVIAQIACNMGWAGIIVNGCVRDIDQINAIDIGIRALGPIPVRSNKRGGGEKDVPVEFAGVLIRDGDWLCADSSGIVVSNRELSVLGPVYRPVLNDQARCYVHTMADYTSTINPSRLFKAHFLNDHQFLPKFLPEIFESIEIVGGDSFTVGCVKVIHFSAENQFEYVKNVVDEIDVDSLSIKYTTIDGDILDNKWDKIVYEIKVKPSTTGSHFKMVGYFYAKDEVVMPKEEDVKIGYEQLKSIHKSVQEFLLLDPQIYA